MRYLTAGESHGEALVGILEGLPSGLKVDIDYINFELMSRQTACGRGSRSSLCRDKVQIIAGLNGDVTTGAPLAIIISNGNCGTKGDFDFYRPGHVDYAADVKYGYCDAALGAERASARETAMRTALGAVAMQLLHKLDIKMCAQVIQIGELKDNEPIDFESSLMCSDSLKSAIEDAGKRGDTVGGKLKLVIKGVKPGFGSHVIYDRRLDYRLSGALMSIPAVKSVECGLGVGFASKKGTEVADCLVCEDGAIARKSNNCGGIEGGISNGEEIEFTLTVKPVPSVAGIETVDKSGNKCLTGKVRGDVCAVPAASIVAKNVAALEIASAIMESIGGDTMDEVIERYRQKGCSCKR